MLRHIQHSALGVGQAAASRPRQHIHSQHTKASTRTGSSSRYTRLSLRLLVPHCCESRPQTCQALSSTVAGAGVVGYLVYRHQTYDPPSLTRLAQLATEAAAPAPPTTPACLPLTGPLQASSTLPPSTIISPSAYSSSAPATVRSSRLRHAINVIRVPARFYVINLLASAAVAGVGMSVGQRLFCGRTAAKKSDDKQAR